MPLGIDYDPTLDTLTITAGGAGPSVRAVTQGDDVILDFNAVGGLIQIEVLNARQHYPTKFLKTLPMATDEVLSLVDAAREFGRDPATLRMQLNKGRLRGTKRGRDWVVTRRAMVAYLESLTGVGRPPKAPPAMRRRATTKA